MRKMEFKMERSGLVEIGDVLPVSEFTLPGVYYYVLGRSYAMSANIPKTERLLAKEGTVSGIEETNRGFYVTVDFDEG